MGLFDFLKAKPYDDPLLGRLVRKGGRWKGSLSLPEGGLVTLLLSGDGTRPDERSVFQARDLPKRYTGLRADIAKHLFEHYQPYAEAIAAGEPVVGSEPPVKINAPSDVWPHAQLERVLIEPLGGVLTVEIAYRVAWDEEHTVGAWIRDWHVFELCGSVGP